MALAAEGQAKTRLPRGKRVVDTVRAIFGPIWDSLAAIIVTLLPAALARLIWHWHQVQEGQRRFWSWWLLIEGCVAVFSMYVGAGIAEWFNAGEDATKAAIGLAAWFGPKGIQALILLALNRYPPKPKN